MLALIRRSALLITNSRSVSLIESKNLNPGETMKTTETKFHSVVSCIKIAIMLLLLFALLTIAMSFQNVVEKTFPAKPEQAEPPQDGAALSSISGDVVFLNVDTVMRLWKRDRKERLLKGPG